MPRPLSPDEYQFIRFDEWSLSYDNAGNKFDMPDQYFVPVAAPYSGQPIVSPVGGGYTLLSTKDVDEEVNPYISNPLVTYWSEETVEEFVNRCRPSKQAATNFNWYIIRNPHATQLPGRGGDRPSCLKEGLKIVASADKAIEAVVAKKGRDQAEPLIKRLSTDLIDLARRHGVTRGHLFFAVGAKRVDEVWSAVCRETLNNNLGDESRVECKPGSRARAGHWLIQVSNRNFDDSSEVRRMMICLRGILGVGDKTQLTYVPHVFDILGANKWNACVVKYVESSEIGPRVVMS